MTELPAWRDVAVPRDDIQDGSFDESSFAADLGLAAAGQGRPEYRDARLFFEQTYLTRNLAVVLDELIRRVDGDPAAAGVYRMQTEFGGGKTHTLLSAYHLFKSPGEVIETACGKDLAARTKRSSFPSARVVVLDGSAMLAGQPSELESGVVAHTLLGHLAYGLGGAEALARVAEQDVGLLGSGTTQLSALLRDYAPCVIVLDETLEYLVKALPVRTNEGDLATTTLTLIKELATAVAGVERAALLATLTSSRPESYSEEGERLLESLQKVVGRQENVVTPVEGDDIFPILARRLFKTRAIRRPAARWPTRTRPTTSPISPIPCPPPTGRRASVSGSSPHTRSTPISSICCRTGGVRCRVSRGPAVRCACSVTRSRRSG